MGKPTLTSPSFTHERLVHFVRRCAAAKQPSLAHRVHPPGGFLLHRERSFLCNKIESRLRDSPPAADRFSDMIPYRRSSILAERFYVIGTLSYDIKKLPPRIGRKLLFRVINHLNIPSYAFLITGESRQFLLGPLPSLSATATLK